MKTRIIKSRGRFVPQRMTIHGWECWEANDDVSAVSFATEDGAKRCIEEYEQMPPHVQALQCFFDSLVPLALVAMVVILFVLHP